MSAVEDLLAALEAGNFDTALDSILDGSDKDGLTKLMGEMDAKAAEISDQDKRHLFKNGVASVKMVIDTM